MRGGNEEPGWVGLGVISDINYNMWFAVPAEWRWMMNWMEHEHEVGEGEGEPVRVRDSMMAMRPKGFDDGEGSE